MTIITRLLDCFKPLDFIAPLAMRLYLVPIFWVAGTNKLLNFESTSAWFGNTEWGLGLPYPDVMVILAGGTEVLGAVLLLLGLGVRLITPPLIVVMLVAIWTVHWQHGYPTIAEGSSEAAQRLSGFLEWLQEAYPQRYAYITALGKPVVLNNGIEFAVTYIIMLIALFFSSSGNYVSLDYWLARFTNRP